MPTLKSTSTMTILPVFPEKDFRVKFCGGAPRILLISGTLITCMIYIIGTSKWVAKVAIETANRYPDPIILPIPPCGDKRNPYFVKLTTVGRNEATAKPYEKHHRGYYLVTTNYPWSVVLPEISENRTVNENILSSPLLQRTSRQAANHRCNVVAANGGPFDKGGTWNSGPTVSKGRLIRTKPSPENSQFVGFGIALKETRGKSSQRQWIMGRYGQLVSSPPKLRIWDFVTGFDWLVYNGKPHLYGRNNASINEPDPTGATRAPRTAIGLDKDSNLMILVVDGCQRCLFRKGLTVEELSTLFVDVGAEYAINMDGGGSSSIVMPSRLDASNSTGIFQDYTVVNRPTCLDLPFPTCEREVATVLCVSSNGTKK